MLRTFTTILFLLFGWISLAQPDQSELPQLKDEYLRKRKEMLNSSNKELTSSEQRELDNIVVKMEELDKESFEYNFLTYINSNYSSDKNGNLLKAYELRPTDTDVLNEMMAMYIIAGNRAKQIEFAKKIQQNYSDNQLDYYRDVLPKSNSGYLLVSNKADAYPLYLLQLLHSEGSGVNIITLDFLKNEEYKIGVQRDLRMGMTQFVGNEQAFMRKMLTASGKEIYVSTTVKQTYLRSISDGMYLTGLCYEWNTANQKEKLESFWNTIKKRDLSQMTLSGSKEQRLYGNYLPPLLTLYKLRKMSGEDAAVLRASIEVLAAKIKQSKKVNAILKEYDMN